MVMCDHETSSRGVFSATVLANTQLCDEHFLIRLRVAPSANGGRAFPPSRAGQFVQVQCSDAQAQPGQAKVVEFAADGPGEFTQQEILDSRALLRRPLSLAGRVEADEGAELEIIYRTVGIGTGYLARLTAGDAISVIGPLGQALPIIPAKSCAVLVGGGVGIPPMLYASAELGRAGKETLAFCGSRSAGLLPLTILPSFDEPMRAGVPSLCCSQFAQRGTPAVIASDDGSVGYPGLVTEPLEAWLDSGLVPPDEIVAYSCGPEPMMRAVGELCMSRGIECYLSLERHMACGMGTCQSCIVKIRDDSKQGWSYKLCCTHGPVFRAEDIVWQ